jgi:hypothetical protein
MNITDHIITKLKQMQRGLIKIIFILTVFLVNFGCVSRQDSIKRLSIFFRQNANKFNFIQKYISNNIDTVALIDVSKGSFTVKKFGKNEGITIRGNAEINIPSFLSDSTNLKLCLKYLDDLEISQVNGNKSFVSFGFRKMTPECYSLWYRIDPFTEISKDCKRGEIYENDHDFWTFLVDSNWYFQREKCY